MLVPVRGMGAGGVWGVEVEPTCGMSVGALTELEPNENEANCVWASCTSLAVLGALGGGLKSTGADMVVGIYRTAFR